MLNDKAIIAAIKDRDEAIMGQVIQQYTKLLWSITGRIMAGIGSVHDQEECVADVFIHLWEKPYTFDPQRGTLKVWLSIIARTKAIDCCRELVRQQTLPLEETALVDRIDLSEHVIRGETQHRLLTAICDLKEPDREIFIRRYYDQQKPREIARAMGINVKQVENHLYQAKQKLRAVIGGM